VRGASLWLHDREHPAPVYVLACAAWIPTLVIWHPAGRFTASEEAGVALGPMTLNQFDQLRQSLRFGKAAYATVRAIRIRGIRASSHAYLEVVRQRLHSTPARLGGPPVSSFEVLQGQ
jgi:hypothetical protein